MYRVVQISHIYGVVVDKGHLEKFYINNVSNISSFSYIKKILFLWDLNPLIDIYSAWSTDLVDIQLLSLFQAFGAEKNYLRIQDDSLTGNSQ